MAEPVSIVNKVNLCYLVSESTENITQCPCGRFERGRRCLVIAGSQPSDGTMPNGRKTRNMEIPKIA